MYLGVVIGRCVATTVAQGLQGARLLVVQPTDHVGAAVGRAEVAVDTVRADVGQQVLLVGSREAAVALSPSSVPVDAAIIGLVEAVELEARPAPEGCFSEVGA